jgi:hypothetical protein
MSSWPSSWPSSPCPLWVISGHFAMRERCPLYPQKRTLIDNLECPLWANSGHGDLIVSTIPRAAAARRPTGIVKLIRHAKSTDAAHRCPALLNGEEAAICGSPSSTRILGAPSSIIAGQRIGWRLRQYDCQHNERRYFSREAHCKAS